MSTRRAFTAASKRGGIGGLLLALCVTAAFNFSLLLFEVMKATNVFGTQPNADGFVVTHCYFGPPIGFYPRFFVFFALLIACAGVFKRGTVGVFISLLGSVEALVAYAKWWVTSHKVFKAFSSMEMDFLNSPEISQVVYLYQGNWLDVCIAGTLLMTVVLLAQRVLKERSPF